MLSPQQELALITSAWAVEPRNNNGIKLQTLGFMDGHNLQMRVSIGFGCGVALLHQG